jgi:hypothetical protein
MLQTIKKIELPNTKLRKMEVDGSGGGSKYFESKN